MAAVFFSVAFRDGDEHVRIMADGEVVAELTPVQAKALVSELLIELSLHSDVMNEVTAPPCQTYSRAGTKRTRDLASVECFLGQCAHDDHDMGA